MVGTRCRVSFLQYLPKKPTKFGIKVWVNSEAKSGYVLNFQIYTGSESGTKEKGLGHCVVMDLMEPYHFKGHCLFIDNFYTRVKLLADLLDKGTYCTGTARPNREYFPEKILPAANDEVVTGNFALLWAHFLLEELKERLVTELVKRELYELVSLLQEMTSGKTEVLQKRPEML